MSQESLLVKTLKDELKRYDSIFREVSDTTINNNVSNYPIFIAHRQMLEVGIPLISNEQAGTYWSYNISTLEELVAKNIVQNERVKNFREVFKDPQKFVCLFVVEEKNAAFVFYPYQ